MVTDVSNSTVVADRGLVHDVPSMEAYRVAHSHVGWGAVVAGGLTAIAFLIMWAALGFAVGIPAYTGTGFGVGSAIYIICSSIVAFFIGGALVTYLTARVELNSGLVHGMLAWSLAIVLMSLSVGTVGLFRGMQSFDVRLMSANGTFTHAQLVGAGWTLFLALILGLIAAALGGAAGLPASLRMSRHA